MQSNTWSSINRSNDRNHLRTPKNGCGHKFVWQQRRRKAPLLGGLLVSRQTLSWLGETQMLLPFERKGPIAERVRDLRQPRH